MKKWVVYFIFLLSINPPLRGNETVNTETIFQKKIQLLPDKTFTLYPKVAGRVSFIASTKSCQKINQGEVIVQLENLPYVIALNEANVNLKKALFELKQEEGKKLIAEKEWEHIDLKYKSFDFGESLALRTFQIEEKKANVLLAESRLKKAEKDLMETEIKAERDDLFVLKYFVEEGQFVSMQDKLASLTPLDYLKFEIEIPMELAKKLLKKESQSVTLTLKQPFEDSPFKKKITLNLNKVTLKPLNFDPVGKKISLEIEFENPYHICSEKEIAYLFSLPFQVVIKL